MKKTIAMISLLALLVPFALCGCREEKKTDLPASDPASVSETEGETKSSGQLSSAPVLGSAPLILEGAGVLLYVKGGAMGEIRPAESRLSGEERNAIQALTFEEGTVVPYDEESGYPTGRSRSLPVTFTCGLDNTAVLFHKAASIGDQLEITADYYRMKADGTLEKYYSVRYENAIVISVGTASAAEGKNANGFSQQTKVSFTYQRATYTYADGSVTYTDAR